MIIFTFFKLGFANLSFWFKKRVRIKQLRLKIESTQKDLTDLFAHIGKEVYREQATALKEPSSQATHARIAELEEGLFALEQEVVLEQKKVPANTMKKKGDELCPGKRNRSYLSQMPNYHVF